MPAELIIDLGSLDLNAAVDDRAGVGRYNPHRGAMALLDAVVWHDATIDHAVGVWHVRDDEFWVPGHIPGDPLLPGVLMVEAGAQLASYMYYKRSNVDYFAGFARIEECVFRERVVPGDTFYLLAKCLKYGLKRFVSLTQGVVGDRIIYEATITGLAFPKMGAVERR